MKYTSILFIALIVLMTSCTKEYPETYIDFSGNYLLEINCEGPLAEANGEKFPIIITKNTTGPKYSVDFGDEVIFQAEQSENVLTIFKQTINEGLGFDEVTMEGEMRFSIDQYIMDIEHSVDDEGRSICSFPMIKQ